VLTLRTVDDSRRLRARLHGHVVIVGAGVVGSEVASTALEVVKGNHHPSRRPADAAMLRARRLAPGWHSDAQAGVQLRLEI